MQVQLGRLAVPKVASNRPKQIFGRTAEGKLKAATAF